MHVELKIDNELFPDFYYRFALFIFKKIQRDVYRLSNKKRMNYEVRKKVMYNLDILPKDILDSLDLVSCINNSLELSNRAGVYIIQLNPKKRIKGTDIKLKQLVRFLEYGSLSMRELPIIRRVFQRYQEEYNNLFDEYIEEEFSV